MQYVCHLMMQISFHGMAAAHLSQTTRCAMISAATMPCCLVSCCLDHTRHVKQCAVRPLHLQPHLQVQCRYLYTELSDASFGDRASAILGRFRDADPTSEAMQALAVQGQMMAQLSYIVDQLKAWST